MPKKTNKTARAIYDLLDAYFEDLKTYLGSETPHEEWEDDILTKSEELLKETRIILEETQSTY